MTKFWLGDETFPDKVVTFLSGIACLSCMYHDRRPCHIEISPLICRTNQCTIFYIMIGSFVVRERVKISNSNSRLKAQEDFCLYCGLQTHSLHQPIVCIAFFENEFYT